MTLSDKLIIDNTHIVNEEDGTVTMKMPLPDGGIFQQKAQSAESAKKHIIAWCDSVRSYMAQKEKQAEEERMAARARRGMEDAVKASESVKPASKVEGITGAKTAVLAYFDNLEAEIDLLGKQIAELTQKRNVCRDERDSIEPIINAWRGVKGEQGESKSD